MERELSVRLRGPAVDDGGISVRELEAIVSPIERGILSMLPDILDGEGRRGKPYELKLTGVASGSCVVALELSGPEPATLEGLSVDPINDLTLQIAGGGADMLPPVRTLVKHLQVHMPDGIDSLELGPATGAARATIAKSSAPAQESAVDPDGREVVFVGRLVSVDWSKMEAAVELPLAARRRKHRVVQLTFRDEDAGLMQDLARHLVRVRGFAQPPELVHGARIQMHEIAKEADDRAGLWPLPRFRWPRDDQLVAGVDPYAFYEMFHEADADGQ